MGGVLSIDLGTTYDRTAAHTTRDVSISAQAPGRIAVEPVADRNVILSVRPLPVCQIPGPPEVQELSLINLGGVDDLGAEVSVRLSQTGVEDKDGPVLLDVTSICVRVVHRVARKVDNGGDICSRGRLAVVEVGHEANADTLVVQRGAMLGRGDVARPDEGSRAVNAARPLDLAHSRERVRFVGPKNTVIGPSVDETLVDL